MVERWEWRRSDRLWYMEPALMVSPVFSLLIASYSFRGENEESAKRRREWGRERSPEITFCARRCTHAMHNNLTWKKKKVGVLILIGKDVKMFTFWQSDAIHAAHTHTHMQRCGWRRFRCMGHVAQQRGQVPYSWRGATRVWMEGKVRNSTSTRHNHQHMLTVSTWLHVMACL